MVAHTQRLTVFSTLSPNPPNPTTRGVQHGQTSDSAAGAAQARAAVPAAAAAAAQSGTRQDGHFRPAGQARHGFGSDSGGAVCCSGFCGSGQPRGAHAPEDRQGGFRGASSEGLQRHDWAAQVQVLILTLTLELESGFGD